MFGPAGLAQRIHAVVYGAVGSLPRTLRAWAKVICHATSLMHMTEAMTHWIRGRHLDKHQFAALFLGRDADDPLAKLLHSAMPRVDQATGHAELGAASADIAAAIQVIGPDRWPRFLAELQTRALDPATLAAIEDQECTPRLDIAAEAHPGDITRISSGVPALTVPQESNPQIGQTAHAPRRPGAGPGDQSRTWGLPLPGTVPPVRNPARLQPGPGSQPSMAGAAGRSLWDDQGGEWQYHPADAWHNPHWDYNEHADLTTPWRSIPIKDLSPWKS